MGKRFARMEDSHLAFILRQRIFFTASAAAEGRVNVSPKGSTRSASWTRTAWPTST